MDASDRGDPERQPPVPWIPSDDISNLARDGDWSFIRDVIDTFLGHTADGLASMRIAAACGDLDALVAGSHALTGSALLMQADRLGELAAEMEQHAKGRTRLDYLAMVDRLDLTYSEIRAAMISYEATLPRDNAPGGSPEG